MQNLKSLIFNPNLFFKSVTKENKYFPIILRFGVVFICLWLIVYLVTISEFPRFWTFIFIVFIPIFIMAAIILALAIPFIMSGISHFGILIVGGKGGFFNTFKPTTYASIIGLVYLAIYKIIFEILLLDPIYVLESMLPYYWRDLPIPYYLILPMPDALIAVLIWVVSFVHVAYVGVVGISFCQKISKVKALVALLIPVLLFLFVGYATNIID